MVDRTSREIEIVTRLAELLGQKFAAAPAEIRAGVDAEFFHTGCGDGAHPVETADRQRRDEGEPLIGADDKPAIDLNTEKMEKFAPQMRKYYYDPTRYKNYLEQLGIHYPTVRAESAK